MAQKKKGGMFSGLTSAVNDMANDLDRGFKSVTTDITNSTVNPLGYFLAGNVVMISSRMALKCLCVDKTGANLSCKIPLTAIHNAAAQFQIVPSTYGPNAYKLRNMAHPDNYLAIVNGFLVGNGKGGPECDFYGIVAPVSSSIEITEYMSLQSAMFPTSFVGVLKNGQVTSPAQTSPTVSHTAHFKLKYIKSIPIPHPVAAQQPSPSTQHTPTQQGQAAPSAPPPGQQYPPQQGQQYPPQQGQQYPPAPPQGQQQYPPAPSQGQQQYQPAPPQGQQQYPPQGQQQYPAATAPPPYYPAPAQQPSPGMEKKPL